MFSIKVTVKNIRLMVGKAGKPNVYKTKVLAQEAADQLNKELIAKVVPAIPVHEIK